MLTSHIFKLKKLDGTIWEVVKSTRVQQWNKGLWSKNHYSPKYFKLGGYILWFLEGYKDIWGSLFNNVIVYNIILLITWCY